MKLKEFDILLDIKRNKKVEEFEMVQGDYETNILRISLVEDFNEYELSGLNVEIAFAKSDGTTVLQDMNNGIELIGNRIVCTLKTNTIASPGKVLAEVRVLQGEKLLTSSRFSFFVRQSIVNDKTIESTNEYPLLQQLTNDVTGIIATESARVTAENIRKIDEIDRDTEEGKRRTAEQNRATTFAGYENRVSTVEQDLVAHKEDYATLKGNLYKELSNDEKPYDLFEKPNEVIEVTSNIISAPENLKNLVGLTMDGNTEGGKSTIGSQRILSRGKNMFDKKNLAKYGFLGNVMYDNGYNAIEIWDRASNLTNRISFKGDFKQTTKYTIQFKGKKWGSISNATLRFYYSDDSVSSVRASNVESSTEYIFFSRTSDGTKTLKEIRLDCGSNTITYSWMLDIDSVQISEGDMTLLEPYRENICYIKVANQQGDIVDINSGDRIIVNENIAIINNVYVPLTTKNKPKLLKGDNIVIQPCIWGYMDIPSKIITDEKYPILSINRVISYHMENGDLIEVDVTRDCTHTTNTLTIGNFNSNNIYFYDCNIDSTLNVEGVKRLEIEIETESDNSMNSLNMSDFKMIAHKGISFMAPENTIPSYELAGKYGYWGGECDLQETIDGHFVLMHDSTIDRMTDGIGNISAMTLEQLKSYNITKGFNADRYDELKIPTLQEYLLACRRGKLVPIMELKTTCFPNSSSVDNFINIMTEHDFLNEAIYCGSIAKMQLIREKAPKSKISLLLNINKENIDTCASLGGDISILTSYTAITKELIEYAHSKGVKVYVWTVDWSSLKYQNMGVDGLVTNISLGDNTLRNTETTIKKINQLEVIQECFNTSMTQVGELDALVDNSWNFDGNIIKVKSTIRNPIQINVIEASYGDVIEVNCEFKYISGEVPRFALTKYLDSNYIGVVGVESSIGLDGWELFSARIICAADSGVDLYKAVIGSWVVDGNSEFHVRNLKITHMRY